MVVEDIGARLIGLPLCSLHGGWRHGREWFEEAWGRSGSRVHAGNFK